MKRQVSLIALAAILACVSAVLPQPAQTQPQAANLVRRAEIVRRVHNQFRTRSRVRPAAQALEEQRRFLLAQADVLEVRTLKGANLLVTFRDTQRLVMFLGEDRLGAAEPGKPDRAPMADRTGTRRPDAIKDLHPRPASLYCAPDSRKALIFDCLEDDANVVTPKASQQAKADLESLGYVVTTRYNNTANLASAALIDDGGYGVVVLRGHGGDLGGDFGFLVRPWFVAWPPLSGYSGTIVASAYNHSSGQAEFGYVITGSFSSAYWANRRFAGTIFFLESCHGADPGALPGMPAWTTNHGASAWLGWNESVSFDYGDKGTVLFFDEMKDGRTVGDALSAVMATGRRPPDLVAYPAANTACALSVWKADANEASVTDSHDFALVKLVPGSRLLATIDFYKTCSVDEFFLYVDTGGGEAADVLVRCRPASFEVYKATGSGVYTNNVHTGAPSKSGNRYSLAIPWSTAFGGATSLRVWLFDIGANDRLPDSGAVVVKK